MHSRLPFNHHCVIHSRFIQGYVTGVTLFTALCILSPRSALAADDPKLDTPAQQQAPTAFAADAPVARPGWGVGTAHSTLIPAVDILGFDFLLNQVDRHFIDAETYGSNFSSFKKNLTGKWVYDSDPFNVNQFLHPYQGSMYFGFARSAGLDYWQAFGYTFAGSLLWETAGETDPPSINDQFTTSIGGALLGEPLFRMASLLLEGGDGHPGFWRELGAAVLSPSTGANRWLFGQRFRAVYQSNDPAVYTRLQAGVNIHDSFNSNVNINRDPTGAVLPQVYKDGEVIGEFTMDYGLPGKPDYSYDRPFDYFHFQFTAARSNVFENIFSRGLLYGTDYATGANVRGIWGLYGMYDYVAPQVFRISTAAVGLGNTNQWWLAPQVAVQSTGLVGMGYGSAGVTRGAGERDYHSGVTSQGLLTSRLIFADRAALEVELRDYYVGGIASFEKHGSENIVRGFASLTWRVHDLHGVTLKYTVSRRDARYDSLPSTQQTVGALSLAYTYLGHTRFGAVDWRSANNAQN